MYPINKPSLSKFLSGNTANPGINLLILIAKNFPEVNINWLMLCDGEMWNKEGEKNEKPLHLLLINLQSFRDLN